MATPANGSLEPQWLAARGHEARGEREAARAVYAAVLRDDPTQAFAWYRLSVLALAQGRYREARDAAIEGTALAVAHRRWKVLPYLTRQLLAFDEREAVRRAIAGSDQGDAAVLAQSAVLAQQLWLADDHDASLRLADAGLRVAPRSHLLHYVRASALRHLGRAAEASAAFERAIALSPDFAEAHWALAQHAAAGDGGARAERVRAALARAASAAGDAVSSPAPGRNDPMAPIFLGYALFRELDSAGQPGAAWEALAAAAAAMRRLAPHDGVAEQATVDALREAFPVVQAAAAPGPRGAVGERTPIFIVGMPRTGTTVLERILGNHSSVADAGELNAFAASMSLALDAAFSSPPTAGQVRAGAALDLSEVGAAYMARTASLYGDRGWLVDKNPLNLFNAGFIARALPRARILCLVRDPMDACFSNFKELFPGGGYGYSYDLAELAAHRRRFEALVAHWSAVLPGRFMTVAYEELVADPATVAQQVMAFCGLPHEPGAIDIARNASPVSTASSSQVRTAIHAGAVGAWRRYERQLAPLAVLLQAGSDKPDLR
jgi:tetratricopeptide (TPR) repeat protein